MTWCPYERLVSLAGIEELRHIKEEGGGLRLGALVTVAQLEYDPRLRRSLSHSRGSGAQRGHAGDSRPGHAGWQSLPATSLSLLSPCPDALLEKRGGGLSGGRQPVSGLPVHYGWPGLLQCARLGPCTASVGAWCAQVSIAGPSGVRTLPLGAVFHWSRTGRPPRKRVGGR